MSRRRAEPVRYSTGLISVVAAATSTLCWTVSTGKKAFIRKLVVRNRQLANIELTIGYLTNAGVPVFTAVAPNLQCLTGGGPDIWLESDLPPVGNAGGGGFIADTTVNTGTLGAIYVQASAAAAAPNDIQVIMEIEEI